MTYKQINAQQRILAIEGIAKLKAAAELFGTTDADPDPRMEHYTEWEEKISELEDWIFGESSIA